jgi:hypothetical protein
MDIKTNSDKFFWHKYVDFYENLLPKTAENILEIGVFKGESIKYWRAKYANAAIYGLDILPPIPEWPVDDKITYFQLDQSDVAQYRKTLNAIPSKLDIIIEDGSHDPLHQKISLLESLDALNTGALYILEDIHTSHPSHPYYKNRLKQFNGQGSMFKAKKGKILMPLQCLLMIEHFKENNLDITTIKDTLDFKSSLFTYEEIVKLHQRIKSITFYKRNVLPNYCYGCKTNNFDFINLKCSCGTDLYSDCDSMTVVMTF